MEPSRVGGWLIGAKGGVASTAILGLMGLKRGIFPATGLVSQLPQFRELELIAHIPDSTLVVHSSGFWEMVKSSD